MYELSLDKIEMITLVRALAAYGNELKAQMSTSDTEPHLLAAELADASMLMLKVTTKWYEAGE